MDTGHPAVIAELEEARRMLSTSRAQLALRILDCAFGGRRDGVHVLCEERACEVAPEPVALVWFMFVAIQFAGHLAKLHPAAPDASSDGVVLYVPEKNL